MLFYAEDAVDISQNFRSGGPINYGPSLGNVVSNICAAPSRLMKFEQKS